MSHFLVSHVRVRRRLVTRVRGHQQPALTQFNRVADELQPGQRLEDATAAVHTNGKLLAHIRRLERLKAIADDVFSKERNLFNTRCITRRRCNRS